MARRIHVRGHNVHGYYRKFHNKRVHVKTHRRDGHLRIRAVRIK